MRIYYLIIFSLLITCSCRRAIEYDNKQRKPLSKAQIDVLRKQQLVEAAKDYAIRGVVDVSEDTIVLLRANCGIELSADTGKSWTWLAKHVFRFDAFTVDDKGMMWGIERWKGIHEPSYCRIHLSKDRGKTWKVYELKPLKFFPFHIHSMPHKPLEMCNYWDNKLYRLNGDNPVAQWQFVKQLPTIYGEVTDDTKNHYFTIQEKAYEQLCVKRKNGRTDTLINFKGVYQIKQVECFKNLIYVTGLLPDFESSYFAVIKNERLLKKFTVPGANLSITGTQLGRIYLTSTSGAFLYTKNTVVPIFDKKH